VAERVGKELSGDRRQQVLNSVDLLHIGTKLFTGPKLPTTADSEFPSLTEDPVLRETPALERKV